MFDLKQPLWLPKGSIRGVLALTMVISGVFAMIVGIDVPDWFALLIGVVIRDYFQTRQDADRLLPEIEESPA